MKEWSIGIIKPDAMNRCREILSLIEERGLKVISQKIVHLDKQSLMEIYKEDVDKDFFQSFCNFMTLSECLAFIVEGENAIEAFNELVGATDPQKAKIGTLRNEFGTDIRRNAIHSSLDKKHFQRELRILFPEMTLDKSHKTRVKISGFFLYPALNFQSLFLLLIHLIF